MTQYDASDAKHVKQARKASERDQRAHDEYMAFIMSTAAGRKWMLSILEKVHIFATSFNGNALQTAFLEGERHVGLDLIVSIMRVCPDQYVQMMREQDVKEITEDGRRSTPSASAPDRVALVAADGRSLVNPTDG